MGEMGDMGGGDMGGGDMGGGADIGGGDMGGGGEGGGMSGIMGGDEGSSMSTGAGESGGGGVGMLSFAVSDNMSGLSGADTGSSKISTTPAEAGAGLSASTKPVNAGATNAGASTTGGSASAGDVASQTPGTTQGQPGAPKQESSSDMFKKAAKAGFEQMNKPDEQTQHQQYQMPNTTYGALFGTPNLLSKQSMPTMQSAQIQNTPVAPPVAPMQVMQAPSGGLPPPMPLQMQAPQAPQIPLTQVQPVGTMSDERAKQRIRDAHRDMDALLQRVYDNVTSKRKR